MRQIFLKICTSLACVALIVTALNVNTTCMLFVHQPKLPDSAKKLRLF